MKNFLSTILIILTLTSMAIFSGCQSTSPLSEATEKISDNIKQSKINAAKTYQQLVKNTIATEYVMTGQLPTNEQIENRLMGKKLSDIKIEVIIKDENIIIKNTNPELSKEDVPDLILTKDQL